MKHLRLFESFQNVMYPDYFEWIKKLLPEEQLFLIFHSALVKGQAGDRFYKGPSPAVEIEDETRKENDPDDDGDGSFSIEISCPVGDESLSVSAECTFSGGFSRYYPATYEDPAEGGDYSFSNIDVEDVYLYDTDNGDDWEIGDLTSDCFTKKELTDLIENYASYKINGEDERGKHSIETPLELPIKLKEKIELLRNPDTVTGLRILNR
jgi:hypothetical protein